LSIPTIIHQTWKHKQIPVQFKSYVKSWKIHHPSWAYRFWDDNDNRHLIQTRYPWFLPIYDNYSFNIQRADAVRYFILYTYGGLYVDLDYECLKPVNTLLLNQSSVFTTEAPEHSDMHDVEYIISNAFMASTPGHPFMYTIMKSLITYTPKQTCYDKFVLETTGPFMLNRVFKHYHDPTNISIIPSQYLSPLTYKEAESLREKNHCEKIQTKLQHAYAVHHHAGTWWKNIEKVESHESN